MISMELPAHATQHGALHLGVGVAVNPGDPAGSTLAAIHPHPQDPLALHHHNHAAATPGGMHEDSKKKRMFLLTNPKFVPPIIVHDNYFHHFRSFSLSYNEYFFFFLFSFSPSIIFHTNFAFVIKLFFFIFLRINENHSIVAQQEKNEYLKQLDTLLIFSFYEYALIDYFLVDNESVSESTYLDRYYKHIKRGYN